MKEKILAILRSLTKSKLIWIPVVLLVAILLYRFKAVFIAATVNGQPISRLSVVEQLEKEGGKNVLDNLITNSLVLQEADKEHVTATPQEISAETDKISNNLKTQGQDLDQALAQQGMTRKDLGDQVKLQILVQKMAGKNVQVTDQEAQDYFKQNQSNYPKGAKFDSVKTDIVNQLTQQKMGQNIQTWLAALKSKAKISHFVGY